MQQNLQCMRYQRDCSKITTFFTYCTYFYFYFTFLLALLTFGIGTNILSLKSFGICPDWYILLIRRVIICTPLSPMHCSSSAEMLSLPQAFPFGRSLIAASISSLLIVYTSLSI